VPVVKLNARNITTLPAIGGVRTDYRDELLPGFFLRVTPQGTRSFGIVYTTRDGRRRRCTLGPVGPLGLSDARAQAKRLRDLRLHDFRRTAASLMTGMGISRLTVKKILNHAERDVTAIYDRHSYDAEADRPRSLGPTARWDRAREAAQESGC
jgi:integrase